MLVPPLSRTPLSTRFFTPLLARYINTLVFRRAVDKASEDLTGDSPYLFTGICMDRGVVCHDGRALASGRDPSVTLDWYVGNTTA